MAGGAWIAVGWFACTGRDLAQYEVKQQSLEKEVLVLRQELAEMRAQMQAMGIVPSGPAAGTAVTLTGAADLASLLPMQALRTGDPPVFPAMDVPERRDTTDCGYRFSIPWLEPISDGTLEESGSGRASPIQLLYDGQLLTPHAGPIQYEKTCKFSFRHQPRYLFFSPAESVNNIGSTWEMRLAPEVPLPRSDEREMYWVYPGTTLTFSFHKGWQTEEWGTLQVELDARVLPVGTPETPNIHTSSEATVTVLGTEEHSSGPKLGFAVTPTPPQGPWAIELSSPVDGPYVLLETLIIGNEHHALVVTAPGALSTTGGALSPGGE